ncbi:Ribosomal silencing factor RsfS [Rickettsiales bacterium Ac37b]|nr:Ribosomal silencing factor RsfS [Rickettsiales bacterium Ac37b]
MLKQAVNGESTDIYPISAVQVDVLKKEILECLEENHAENIQIISLANKSNIADYMIVATGRMSKHTVALADKIMCKMKNRDDIPFISCEGIRTGDWVLVDLGDIIVHIFKPEIREIYNLEKMWSIVL